MSLNRRQQIDYTQKYQILSGRVNYANYVIRNQLVNEGRLLGLNIYFPDNDASAVTLIQEGIVATTPEEVATYLGNINQTSIQPVPAPPTIPGAPTGLSAIPGNTEAIISFTPGTDGSSPITNYEYWITDLSGSTFQAFSPPQVSSPVTITGLTNGIEYNIRLRAVNSVGPGIQSEIVIVTPATVPDAPTSVTASPGNTQASVSFTAPANNGGSSITSYTVTSSPGGFTATGASSPLTVTGLTNGVAYTFTVVATNSVGNSVASTASAAVTPVEPGAINVIILGDAAVATLSSALQSARTALGYSQPLNITTQQLNGYTGANLSSFNVVIYYNNGGLNLNATLGGNMNTFVSGGGHLIMASFSWGNVPAQSGFTYNSYSTYQYKGTYSSVTTATAVYTVSHPITTGVATSTGLGAQNIPNPIALTTIPSSQVIATFADGGSTSFIAVGQNGSAKLVGINAYVATSYSSAPNTIKYVCNSIYWCMGYI